MSVLLETEGVTKRFGGVTAVDSVSLSVAKKSIHGLIGPNGSGKTTLLGVLAGTHRADGGKLILDGKPLPRSQGHRVVRAGIARTFQTTKIFRTWTLEDSLRIAEQEQRRNGERIRAREAAATVGLSHRMNVQCGSLTNAEQRLAMIAMAVATHPKLVLLDEPAVGMSEPEARALGDVITRLRSEFDMSVLVVEHNMHFLMRLVDRVTVMAMGRVLAEGTPAEVRSNADVIASYLGTQG